MAVAARAGREPLQKVVQDRDDELQAGIRNEGLAVVAKKPRDARLGDGPVSISHDTLMGKMPKGDKILKKGDLWKLTSSYEWKPFHAALTTMGLFISRPDEDILRDLIPLYEVAEVKKRNDIPGESSNSTAHENGASDNAKTTSASVRSIRLSSLMVDVDSTAPVHVVQIRTIENGYNSGRTYYFKAESDEECTEWVNRLRAESDHAVMLKQAGPAHSQQSSESYLYMLAVCAPLI